MSAMLDNYVYQFDNIEEEYCDSDSTAPLDARAQSVYDDDTDFAFYYLKGKPENDEESKNKHLPSAIESGLTDFYNPGEGLLIRDLSHEQKYIRDGKEYKKGAFFVKFTSLKAYENYLGRNYPGGVHNCHEVILGDINQKLKFDFDSPPEIGSVEDSELVDNIVNAFNAYYKKDINPYDVLLLDASTYNNDGSYKKFSKHIVINKYYVTSHREAGAFAVFTKAYFEEECSLDIHFDDVYKRCQNFRMFGATKDGRPFKYKYIENDDWECADDYTPLLWETLITNVDLCEKLPEKVIEAPKEGEFVRAKVTEEQKEKIEAACKVNDVVVFDMGKQNGNQIPLSRRTTAECIICKRTHDTLGAYVAIFRNKGIFYCRAALAKRKLIKDDEERKKYPVSVELWRGSNKQDAITAAASAPKVEMSFMDYMNIPDNDRELVYTFVKSVFAFIVREGESFWAVKRERYNPASKLIELDYMLAQVGKLTESNYKMLKKWNVGTQKVKHARSEDEKPIIMSLYDALYDMKDQITYTDFIFYPQLRPEPIPGGMFNMFSGFTHKYEQEKPGDAELIAPIIQHMSIVWANQREDHLTWLLNWFAHIVQFPTEKMEVAPIGTGEEGGGKGIVVEFMGNFVLGRQYYTSANGINALFDTHNTQFFHRLLTLCDETKTDEMSREAIYDGLKGLIQQKTFQYRAMRQDKVPFNDYNNYIFLSNRRTPLPVSLDARRFFAFACDNRFCQNIPYFTQLRAHMTPAAGAAMFRHLANRNLTGWNAQVRPHQPALDVMKLDNQPRAVHMLKDYLTGRIEWWKPVSTGEVLRISWTSLYANYEQYCGNEGNQRGKQGKQNFTELMKSVVPESRPRIGGRQTYGWQATGGEIRAGLRKYLRMPELNLDAAPEIDGPEEENN